MKGVRPSLAALNGSGRFKYKAPSAAVDNLVVGGGVVGLAIARRLAQQRPDKTTILVERHSQPGQETSSRNSEVIHAGIYYPPKSLKTLFCLRGRHLLYEYCQAKSIPHERLGKLVVAEKHQMDHLSHVHRHSQGLRQTAMESSTVGWAPDMAPETTLLSGEEARELEPNLSPSITGAVLSSSTGIIDSHSLMQAFEADILDASPDGNASLAYSTRVVRVDVAESGSGWDVQFTNTSASDANDTDCVRVTNLINASGLSGNLILNSLIRNTSDRIPMYYAKGSYVSYGHGKKAPGAEKVTRLMYPVPDGDKHAFASLGTHLTLDIEGNVRFGPDLEWIEPLSEAQANEEDTTPWWEMFLRPEINAEKLQVMHSAITRYLLDVQVEFLRESYVGIRPKLVGPGSGFQDFEIRENKASDFGGRGDAKLVSLLGIESPGLTSCMAIADEVEKRIPK